MKGQEHGFHNAMGLVLGYQLDNMYWKRRTT